ncbi:MAG: acyl-CoA-binding protein [Flavobacteriaceae bacterium]|nr:acyl-CoA-binding protein [Flavobacteriaceae bacterium]
MNYAVVDKTTFDESVEWVNENFNKIPKDDLLRLYAYYKIANGVRHESNNKQPIVKAFKANAIMQVSNLSIDIAQDRYSALVEKLKHMV